jgi:ankyrin repeat protein
MGENFDLNGAVFHAHVKLCAYILGLGADVNYPLQDTGETPLHAAFCKPDRTEFQDIVKLLLQHGADPNVSTKAGIETGAFMRDCRTKGETPLHRAAAFGSEESIQMLLDAGGRLDVKDMNGDSPLSWGSWYARPRTVLKKLCYGDFRIR